MSGKISLLKLQAIAEKNCKKILGNTIFLPHPGVHK